MSAPKFIVLLDDGRFVARWDGKGRYYAREYPEAFKFSERRATTEAAHLNSIGMPCRAVSETEYAQS